MDVVPWIAHWIMIASDGIQWYLIVFDGSTWYSMVFDGIQWRLDSEAASSFFKAYSSCVRWIWRLPLDTFTDLVEGHLSLGLPPLRNVVLGSYSTFYQH